MSPTAAALVPASPSEVEGPSSELSANSDTLSKDEDDDCTNTCRRPLAVLALARTTRNLLHAARVLLDAPTALECRVNCMAAI